MPLQKDKDRLLIYHEGRKRRVLVAELKFLPSTQQYALTYNQNYVLSNSAIPLGPELSLFQLQHLSNKGQLFPSLLDRLPSRENPAYEDYCRSQGISKDEDNLLVLLGTIGKRGPSSFIFEPVYNVEELTPEKIVKFRTSLGMTQHDFAAAFDFSKITINRLEAGHSQDPGSLARIKIYLEFPEVPLWQLKQTGGRIHGDVLAKATAELHRRMRRA